MDLARYVVEAVVLEGRSYREVARTHGVSKSWVAKLVVRYRSGGYPAIEPRSRAPKTIPHPVAGGYGATGPLASAEIYDPAST